MKRGQPFLTSRKKIRTIRISRTGWAFILLTIALGFAGLNTGNNLLYLIFGTLLSMLLINGALSTSSLHNLSVRVSFPLRLYANENCPLKIEVKNHKKRLPSYAIMLTASIDKKDKTAPRYFIFKLAAGEVQSVVHPHKFSRRGLQKAPRFMVHTSYPFGLIQKFIPIPAEEPRLVYPELKPQVAQQFSTTFHHGDYLSGKRGVGVNPYGVREFQVGDDVRHLHWASFAKSGKWIIKEFEQEKKSRITLHLLVHEDYPTESAAIAAREETVSIAASLLMHFIDQNRQVSLLINGRALQPVGGGYIDYYLSTLALFDTKQGRKRLPPKGPSLVNPGTIIAVSELKRESLVHANYDLLISPAEPEEVAA